MIKFLVARFSSIGDIVLTTPIIRCLKNQIEDARIHYVSKAQYFSLLKHNPYIDRIHLYSGNLTSLIRELRKEQFDYIIDLHHNLRSTILKSRVRAISFSFPKLNFEKWLMVHLKINRLPHTHIVDRYFEAVRLFDVTNDHQGLDFFIPDEDEISPAEMSKDLQKGYIAFVIGAKHGTKKLTPEKIIGICRLVDHPIVLLGGSEDVETGKLIENTGGGKILNACGQYTINQSASLVKQAKLVITHDTGMMHIAAAFQKRIVSIWGNTIPEFGMYPYLPDPGSVMVEVKNLSCRPCSKIGFETCPKKHFKCIQDIDIEYIADIVSGYMTG